MNKNSDLKLKSIVQKTKRVEEKFWDNYKDDSIGTDSLLESSISIIKFKGIIITELNRKIHELEQEVLEAYEDGLSHQIL